MLPTGAPRGAASTDSPTHAPTRGCARRSPRPSFHAHRPRRHQHHAADASRSLPSSARQPKVTAAVETGAQPRAGRGASSTTTIPPPAAHPSHAPPSTAPRGVCELRSLPAPRSALAVANGSHCSQSTGAPKTRVRRPHTTGALPRWRVCTVVQAVYSTPARLARAHGASLRGPAHTRRGPRARKP